jgi:hypothetical protein
LAQQHINYGVTADDTNADSVRTAFLKTEGNFNEVYSGALLPVANATTQGISRPDNTTITVTNGVLTAVGGGGGGSGSVGAGTANQLAYYGANGTTVSGLSLNAAFTISGGSLLPVFGTTAGTLAQGNHTHSIYAPLASPLFTGVITLPSWTTGTRPGTPAAAQVGYATDTNRFEGYNGTSWLSFLRSSDIPAASGQLLGGSGTAGTASGVAVGAGLSLSSGTLIATGVAAFVRTTITASSALTVPSTGITEYLIDSASPLALTLAVPTADVELFVKRKDKTGGAHTLTLNADGAAGSVYTFNSPEGGDGLHLRGNVTRGTWEVLNINDPGFLFSDLASMPTNPTSSDLLSLERSGTPYKLPATYYAPTDSPVFTTSLRLPNWTTAGRPATPAAGVEGWNTDLVRRETWNGSVWNQYVRAADFVATNSQLFGGTGTNGVAAAITLGSNLSLSGGVLNSSAGSAAAGGTSGQYQINSGGALAGITFSGDITATTGGVVSLANNSTARGNLGLTAMATLATAARGAIVYMGASGPATLAAGTSGLVLTTNGASADPTWTAAAGSSGGSYYLNGTLTAGTAGTLPRVDIFTTTGSYTVAKDAQASRIHGRLIGAGGGGGGGGAFASGTATAGAGGGGGGACITFDLPAAKFGTSLSITVPAGTAGGGGVSNTITVTASNPSTNAVVSTTSPTLTLTAYSGQGGGGGTTGSLSGAGAGGGSFGVGLAGGGNNAGGGAPGANLANPGSAAGGSGSGRGQAGQIGSVALGGGCAGGASAGGITATPTSFAGAAGAMSPLSGCAGGTAGAIDGNGGNAGTPIYPYAPGASGGSGGSSIVSNGGNAGTGTGYGFGGSGGGTCLTGFTGGNGSAGGDGLVYIVQS